MRVSSASYPSLCPTAGLSYSAAPTVARSSVRRPPLAPFPPNRHRCRRLRVLLLLRVPERRASERATRSRAGNHGLLPQLLLARPSSAASPTSALLWATRLVRPSVKRRVALGEATRAGRAGSRCYIISSSSPVGGSRALYPETWARHGTGRGSARDGQGVTAHLVNPSRKAVACRADGAGRMTLHLCEATRLGNVGQRLPCVGHLIYVLRRVEPAFVALSRPTLPVIKVLLPFMIELPDMGE